jgi:hypothetical protein
MRSQFTFAERLAALVPHDQVRMRRDFTQLLTLIQAHAVLYQRQRERADDSRIIATIDDYRAVYELVAPIFQAIAAGGITPQLRETVRAVKALTPNPDDRAGIAAIASHLKLDKSAIKRRVQKAVRAGWLVNEETRSRQPAKLRVGDPLPEECPTLPSPENRFTIPSCTSAPVHQSGENPHDDAENTVAPPNAPGDTSAPVGSETGAATRHTAKPMHQSVHQSFLSSDAENQETSALDHRG